MRILRIVLVTIYLWAAFMLLGSTIFKILNKNSKTIVPINDGFSVFALADNQNSTHDYRIYGYLPYWHLNRVEYLQLDKLTDIAYFALRLNSDGSIKVRNDDGTMDPGYNHWKNSSELDELLQRAKHYNVNVALAIISHDDEISDEILDCQSCWVTTANEIIRELKYRNLKDINLDFEYVGSPEDDKIEKYSKFVKYLNAKLDEEFGESEVTVASFADSSIKKRITNPEELALNADSIFIMAYDFHYPNGDRAGPVAPINRDPRYTSYDVTSTLRDYLKKIPPSKLILGVPYYGYNWVVESPDPYSLRLDGNDYIGYSQSQTYEVIMDSLLTIKPNIVWDEIAQVPYYTYVSSTTGMNRMVYFENVDSLRIKYQLVKNLRLGGVDTLILFPIYEKQLPLLSKYKLLDIAKLEFAVTTVVGDMELKGVYVDQKKWREIISHLGVRREEIAKEFQEAIRPYYKVSQTDLFGGGCGCHKY